MTLESSLNWLELEARGDARPLDALARDTAIGEESLTHRNAAHLQTLELLRLIAFANDQLGAAAADIYDEPATGLIR